MNAALASSALELTEERTFTARLHGRIVTGLLVDGKWEGMTKYRHLASGLHVIVLDDEARIVKGSPALMDSLGLGLAGDDHWAPVPARMLPNGRMVAAWMVARYPCAKGEDGKILLSPSAKPWTNITQPDASAACIASGYLLTRESQEQALRLDVCAQDINWTGGKVGSGKVYQGLYNGTVSSAQAANYVSADPEERSWHELSNGQRIYGLAGNIYTHSFDDIQGDERGLVVGPIAADSTTLTAAPYPSREKGMGYRATGPLNWPGVALVRGGGWGDDDYAGLFGLDYCYPDYALGNVGFRCAKPIL